VTDFDFLHSDIMPGICGRDADIAQDLGQAISLYSLVDGSSVELLGLKGSHSIGDAH
jgi:hypothetical protein